MGRREGRERGREGLREYGERKEDGNELIATMYVFGN